MIAALSLLMVIAAQDQVATDVRIPEPFHGKWFSDPYMCDPGLDSQVLYVSDQRMEFYEAAADPKAVEKISQREVVLSALVTHYDGETSMETYRLRLSKDGSTLTETAPGWRVVRHRCRVNTHDA